MLRVWNELIQGVIPGSSLIRVSHHSSERVLLCPPPLPSLLTGLDQMLHNSLDLCLPSLGCTHLCCTFTAENIITEVWNHILVLFHENWFWFLATSECTISIVQRIIFSQREWQLHPCLDAACVFTGYKYMWPNVVAKLGCFLWCSFIVQEKWQHSRLPCTHHHVWWDVHSWQEKINAYLFIWAFKLYSRLLSFIIYL